AWDDVISCIAPLCRWIEEKNKEQNKCSVSPGGEITAPKGFNFKAIDPEEEAYWFTKQMDYFACGLGGVALIPAERSRENEPEILLVLTQNKKSSPTRIHDILTYNKDLCEMAAADRLALIFAPSDGRDDTDNYTQILQEICSLAHLKGKKIWLDVSAVYENGLTLKAIPGFTLKTPEDEVVTDPDSEVVSIGSRSVPCLDVTKLWYERTCQMYTMGHLGRATNGSLDPMRLAHSQMGKRMAEFMCLEHDLKTPDDPRFQAYFEQRGLSIEFHEHAYDQWISVVPKCAMSQSDIRLPLIICIQDIPGATAHSPLVALSQHSGFLDLAGQGDCCLMFFCMEQLEDFDILPDLLTHYADRYPADLTRVYAVGHSHNGGFAFKLSHRFPKLLAGIGTLGNRAGFIPSAEMGPQTQAVDDEEIEFMRAHADIPTINVCGSVENACEYPLYRDDSNNSSDDKLRHYNRRMRAFRCKEFTKEDLLKAKSSSDYTERFLGVPADKTECLYLDGVENFIADYKNSDGKYHLRQLVIGNLPHTVSPLMCDLVFGYLRRFAKNRETGECIELY
ncbi:MAG: hypothetical protein HDT33_09615, partial [Clostridiales bacterium]|nr:hypothetical protein [Clostridiales bacterium]